MGPPEQGSGGVLAAAVSWVTELLAGDDAWDERLSEAMERLGRAAVVDRAFVFQNVRDPQGRLWMDKVAWWRSETCRPGFGTTTPSASVLPDFAALDRHPATRRDDRGPVATVPGGDVLANDGTRATIQVPLRCAGEWWGFVGFDDCRTDRGWTVDERRALEAVAEAMDGALQRLRREEDVRLHEERYRSMVENGPAITYIDGVDDTASTLYISRRSSGSSGTARTSGATTPSSGRGSCILTIGRARSRRTNGTTRRANRS